MFTFLTHTGTVAFVRADAETAYWTEEEMSMQCEFPFDKDKVIERGMRILFQDPATAEWKAYEIRKCTTYPGEYSQQITAEDIAISELTDEHIANKTEITNKTAVEALTGILSGTGWSIGTSTASGTSSGDVSRGSVWQAVGVIQKNWNIYINTRVTIGANGITGKYLDILPAQGVWRGIRLAVNKNMLDPCVDYDDSELYTALYGYGGSIDGGDDLTFANVTWTETADHPAKPAGQKYLEDPVKTALYGRNGRPRFNYYQNTGIEDANVLLQKTWETLKSCSDPKISISGTATDLERLGYTDEPLRLHDMAIIDLEPVGVVLYKKIIQLTVNLLDPTDNRINVGDYIPNIIYINRKTEGYATGGSAGVGNDPGSTETDRGIGSAASKSKKNSDDIEDNKEAIDQNRENIATNTQNIATNTQDISLQAEQIELQAEQITLVTEKADENGDILAAAGISIDPTTGVAIYATDAQTKLGSMFNVQSDKIGMVVGSDATGNYIKAGEICLAINATTGQSTARILADHVIMDSVSGTPIDVVINGKLTASELAAAIGEIQQLRVQVIYGNGINIDYVNVSNNAEITTQGIGIFSGLIIGSNSVSWQTVTIGGTTYHLLGY